MDALLIIDMQEGAQEGDQKLDFGSVVVRINELASAVRKAGGRVVYIQHNGRAGEPFEPNTPGWNLLGSLRRSEEDLIVQKTLNDAFFGTNLHELLQKLKVSRVLIAGWATDFCVDATIRTAAALGYHVCAISDCHTLGDRVHLDAEAVKMHHHAIWTNLISANPVRVELAAEVYSGAR